jgi:hypothetical protein
MVKVLCIVGLWFLPSVGNAQFQCRDEVEQLRRQNDALQQQVQSLQRALAQRSQNGTYRPPHAPYGYGQNLPGRLNQDIYQWRRFFEQCK